MLESDILHKAIEQLEQRMQVQIEVETTSSVNGHRWDAEIDIQTGTAKNHFKVEVKGSVLPANLARWAEKLQAADTLLVANYISNPAKTLLEQQGINYLDTAGNCFIRNDKGIFWHVVGQSNSEDSKVTKHRAFQKNGIKLIYALLLNEALLNEPYRVMAEAANIAASTVGDILTDLQAAKFLVQINDREMKLVNKPELLSQWVTAFNQKLRPKLLRGKFRLPFPSNQIQYFKLREGDYWGGEPAADLLTNYLYPGNWTLFSEKDRKSLITDYRLIPDPKNGNLEVYSPFWKGTDERFVIKERQVVSPLLVYAELIGSGNDRNFETARKIYVQYLQDIIEQGH